MTSLLPPRGERSLVDHRGRRILSAPHEQPRADDPGRMCATKGDPRDRASLNYDY